MLSANVGYRPFSDSADLVPHLKTMKKISEQVQRKLDVLLKHLETHGMEREEMAFFIGMIYICGYRGNTVLYMSGNKPDVKRPPASENAQRIREYREAKRLERTYKFVPRMDVAASWMQNPC